MFYDFRCKECSERRVESFLANDYDKYVHEDGRLKRKRCKKCKTISLYRHIITTPAVLGGTKGYISIERWQRMHPENYQRKQASLEKRMTNRHRKRVLDRINKAVGGGKRKDRHKGYGKDQSEERLSDD